MPIFPDAALPPPFPWVAMAAVAVSCLVLGAVGGFQFALQRRAPETQPSAVAAPVSERAVPAPVAPAPSDTEVAVNDTPAAARVDESVAKAAPDSSKAIALAGRILVRSTPAGASVSIDGKPAGRTPLTARDLALTGHTIVVSRPGFLSETRRVTLSGRTPSSNVTVTLEAERGPKSGPATKAAATGSLTVDSRPKGAQVTIDGRAIGATPLTAPGLAPGVHSVRVELAGHKPVTTTVSVKAGETAKLAVTLEVR